jgi:ABC-2 type transport system ATP-binding protein
MKGKPMFAVETDALTRTYSVGSAAAPIVALRDVSLTINEGEVHGLLGPNGAGKTTLVKILSTVLLPTSGRALVHGYDVGRAPSLVRPLIGLVFGGDKGLYQRLTGRQNLEYWAALYQVPTWPKRRRCAIG